MKKDNNILIRDPSVYRYMFLSRWHAGEDAQHKKVHWNCIVDVIGQAWYWTHQQIGQSRSLSPTIISVNEMGRRESFRLKGTDWLRSEDQSLSVSFDSKLLLDSAIFIFGFWPREKEKEEKYVSFQEAVKIFMANRKSLNDFHVESKNFTHIEIGEIQCLYAEVPRTDISPRICEDMLRSQLENDTDDISVCIFDWGFVGVPVISKSPILILSFYEESCIESASWFLNDILPRLALSYLKIDLDSKEYEAGRSEIEEAERKLTIEIEGSVSTGNLRRLEDQIIRISTFLDVLVEKLGRMSQRKIGMETNIGNMEETLTDKILTGKQKEMRKLFIEGSALAVEQIKVDLDYFQVRNDEAQLALRTLHALVDTVRGQMERIIAVILGIGAIVVSLLDGFSDELSTKAKIAILGGGILACLTVWIYDYFKRKKKEKERQKIFEKA